MISDSLCFNFTKSSDALSTTFDFCKLFWIVSSTFCCSLHNRRTYPGSSLWPVRSKVSSVKTVRQEILCNPLIIVTPSLCCDTCHLHWSSQVNLKPLMMVADLCAPRPSCPACSFPVQPSQACAVVRIPLGWGTELLIAYFAIFHSYGAVAFWAWKYNS